MVFVPFPQTTEVSINQILHGERIQNTLYALRFGDYGAAELELLAGEVITWLGTSLYPALSSELTLSNVSCRRLNVADGVQFVATPAQTVAGGNISQALPGSVAACASFRTGLVGRSRRGRNYVPGLPESGVNGNTLTPALQDAIRSAYQLLLASPGPLSSIGFIWVVASRYSGTDPDTGRPIPRAAGLATAVSSVVVDGFVDSQRRRLAGRGT